ncbi:hypothetical protein [Neptuniibacter sp. QD37_11]|uniref:hypothetical protein n=1 Tax=Neptuniibacter sp. QD37_11 TaxID=3398209 RepID=UPI0039F4B0DA
MERVIIEYSPLSGPTNVPCGYDGQSLILYSEDNEPRLGYLDTETSEFKLLAGGAVPFRPESFIVTPGIEAAAPLEYGEDNEPVNLPDGPLPFLLYSNDPFEGCGDPTLGYWKQGEWILIDAPKDWHTTHYKVIALPH